MGIINISSDVAEPTAAEIETTTPEPEAKKEIVLTGSLSKIYTDALNSVLANESSSNMIEQVASNFEIEENNIYQDGENEDEDRLFVFTEDGDNMSHQSLVDGINTLTYANKKYKKILLGLEGKTSNSRAGLLEQYARSLNIPVYISRRSCINAILSK